MRDRVTSDVALEVFTRDQGCVAPRLGGTFMDCWGDDRLEHVKPEPRLGVRAPSCLCGLVVLCQGHTEDGMRAGRVWCTDRRNRQACRDYLHDFGYGPHVPGHMDAIRAGVA